MNKFPRRIIQSRNERGQGVIEFILALFAFFTVAFLYVQVALGFGVANYIQYATFLAARAYQSGAASQRDQQQAARTVLEQMLTRRGKERFATLAKANGSAGDPPGSFIGASPRVRLRSEEARKTAWEQGVTYKFDMRLYLMPLVRGAKTGKKNLVTLESESWLDREPTEEECIDQLAKREKKSGVKNAKFLFDNGC